jgi:hypothetical protein
MENSIDDDMAFPVLRFSMDSVLAGKGKKNTET